MTNESISGFLNSIAEAKRAFDAEPDYQRQIRDLENDKKRLGDTVAHRELRIHELKQVEETLTQKLRSVEAERDDAGFRALEEADKVQIMLKTMQQLITDTLTAVAAVEGVEPPVIISRKGNADTVAVIEGLRKDNAALAQQSVRLEVEIQTLRDDMRLAEEQLHRPFASDTLSSEGAITGRWSHEQPYADQPELPRSVSEAPQGQSEVDPTVQNPTTSISECVTATVSGAGITTSVSIADRAQSETPFAETTLASQSETATSNTAAPLEGAALNASPPERNRDESTRFKDRKYYDVTYFVPLVEWLAKGGTETDYNWRPASALPEASRASHNS